MSSSASIYSTGLSSSASIYSSGLSSSVSIYSTSLSSSASISSIFFLLNCISNLSSWFNLVYKYILLFRILPKIFSRLIAFSSFVVPWMYNLFSLFVRSLENIHLNFSAKNSYNFVFISNLFGYKLSKSFCVETNLSILNLTLFELFLFL